MRPRSYMLADVEAHLWVLAFLIGVQLAILLHLSDRVVDATVFIFGPADTEPEPDPCTEPGEAAREARRRAWLAEHDGETLADAAAAEPYPAGE